MKLFHLGATYTFTTQTIETVETDIKCHFLGKTSNLRVAKQVQGGHARQTLTYRGIRYQK
ncbi:MAG: DUF4278 domain-containing protein [Cyanobacteria bacterium J06648_16]